MHARSGCSFACKEKGLQSHTAQLNSTVQHLTAHVRPTAVDLQPASEQRSTRHANACTKRGFRLPPSRDLPSKLNQHTTRWCVFRAAVAAWGLMRVGDRTA